MHLTHYINSNLINYKLNITNNNQLNKNQLNKNQLNNKINIKPFYYLQSKYNIKINYNNLMYYIIKFLCCIDLTDITVLNYIF